MSNGGPDNPSLCICQGAVRGLRRLGCDPTFYYAATALELLGEDPTRPSQPLPFRLDTGTGISTIPEAWLGGQQQLRRVVKDLSDSFPYNTGAGQSTGRGRIAKGVHFRFFGFPTAYPLELVLSS